MSPIPNKLEGEDASPLSRVTRSEEKYLKLDYQVQLKNIPKLKNNESSRGSMKEWMKFYEGFTGKMRSGNCSNDDSITHLLQSIHDDLVRDLEEDSRGISSNSLDSCLELLKELFVGRDWKKQGELLFRNFRRL